jgi:glyoxylase-like metal-dependent hydrolase (beta-lactamase superfamily II)
MIKLDVYVSPYKPVVSVLPEWNTAEQATWPASSVSLLSGVKEAILIDALMTFAEAEHLVEWIRATGKDLVTVYITHGHGDHFFGLSTILAAFPEAKAVALPEIVPFAQEQVGPGYLSFWKASFPNQIPEHPHVPEPMQGNVMVLEGHELRPIMVGQSDTAPSSVVHIPDLEAVVGGDVAYNGIHCWLAQTDPEKRKRWIASLDRIAALDPGIIVAGHKAPDARDDDPQAILAATKTYIRDFDRLVTESAAPKELIDKMMQLHGERGNPYTLWTAAYGVAEQLATETSRRI